jgi:BirA family transcriptional regulator, biotin operon repressor / biotin---[acetyl-CoA-carboxylase] ligase
LNSSLPDGLSSPQPLPDELAEALARASARLGPFSSRVLYFSEVPSTNDLAGRLAARGAEEGTVVVAEAQSAGRGRLGRSWFSPPGAGLYVSLILRPADSPADRPGQPPTGTARVPSLITLTAGVAVAEALRKSAGVPVQIKWPNDLVLGVRKLGGILTEAAGDGVAQGHAVVGIGINLRTTAYPSEIADRATSIESELGRPVDRGVVLAEILAGFAARYADLSGGRIDAILARWRDLAPSSRGARVAWTGPEGHQEGTTAGIDDDGALLIRAGTTLQRVIAGEVRWL